MPQADRTSDAPADGSKHAGDAGNQRGPLNLGITVGGGAPWLWIIIVIVVLILIGAGAFAIQTMRLNSSQTSLHRQIAYTQEVITTYETKARQIQGDYRDLETRLSVVKNEIDDVRMGEQHRIGIVADAWAADAERLRNEISAANRRGRAAAPAACHAESDRAEASGILLSLYMQADGESARTLESQAADIRALQSWGRAVLATNEAARDSAAKTNARLSDGLK